MSPAVWFSLLLACVVISFTPGAGAINTMSNALNQGWMRSIWGIVGQQLALVVHVVIVAAGVGLLVSRSETLFTVIRYAGAAYLVYLGVRLILTRPSAAADIDAQGAASREGHWSMIRRGFWVNLLNPKAIVFFLAFIPQFIRLDEPQLPQYLVLVSTVIVVDILVMWGFFAAAARPFRRFTRSPRGQRTLNTVFGLLFIGVAALLAFLH
ncbi:LysE family transporter [Microbacterium hydrocarbonoxydans]|uniref:LysE family transporter n=1 Tax=Microbacterium hydrocarbonoxydans TaxID=273678 RepID=UPI002040D921|nr:LysE family transporter [Microbacterium hydrocarbonoxydans]MCM3778943.1 LysE family transporter [Microbacterium hydrocarbonoxydans]